MTVYIVQKDVDYNNWYIEGVFDTFEEACAFATAVYKQSINRAGIGLDVSVEAWPVGGGEGEEVFELPVRR